MSQPRGKRGAWPPITTIFIANARSSVAGRWSPLGCATSRDARFFPGAPTGNQERKFSDRAPSRSGITARLAQNGACDRDNHVRKSRSQCTDPDTGHSRDDRGRDDGAHRDADTPKAIGTMLIDSVRDQHRSQPRSKVAQDEEGAKRVVRQQTDIPCVMNEPSRGSDREIPIRRYAEEASRVDEDRVHVAENEQ